MEKRGLLIIFMSLIVLGILFISGCAEQQNTPNETNNSENNSTLANPASVHCINNNGTLEIRNNEVGQYGVCIKDGKECEEWAYYRGECEL